MRNLAAVAMLIVVCTSIACHHRRAVRIEVFEDHLAVDGVRLDAPIQQAVDVQMRNRDTFVLLISMPPLSASRSSELTRAQEKLYADAGIGVRRVQFVCVAGQQSKC
jgi:hypothetical protein